MCGNGVRCVAKFVYDHGIAAQAHVEHRNRQWRLEHRTRNPKRTRGTHPRRYGRADFAPCIIPTTLVAPEGVTEPVVNVPFQIADENSACDLRLDG